MPNHIKEKHAFQPTKNALEAWLKTRKRKRVANGYVLPGFFSTHLFVWDALFSIMGFSVEIIIFVFFMQQVELDDLANWIALPVVMILDFVFIFLVHSNKSPKIKFDNALMFLNEPYNPLITQKIDNETQLAIHYNINPKNFLSYLGILFEVASCAAKIYFLNAAYGLSIEPISIGIVVGYILQTFAYILSAGYFLWEIITDWFFIDWQYSKYRKMQGTQHPYIAQKHDILFSSHIKLGIKENATFQLYEDTTKAEEEKKKFVEGQQPYFYYKLVCIGIPLDDDIVSFASMQPSIEARKEMMFLAHKLQLDKFASMN